jgi:hypothetical protein
MRSAGRGRPPQAAARRAGLEVVREDHHRVVSRAGAQAATKRPAVQPPS